MGLIIKLINFLFWLIRYLYSVWQLDNLKFWMLQLYVFNIIVGIYGINYAWNREIRV
jgi:hypothetical protein